MSTVLLDDLADVRAGDKGDALMLSVFPRDPADADLLSTHLTAEVVARHFGAAVTGPVTRTVLPRLPAFVFAIPGVLAGGVTGSTVLDGHGKTLSYHLLTLELPIRPTTEGEST
ncbi:AtuA-related protein [Saccharomonospora viridis]|jgi:hypothetical protein|uniref:AtuA-like ferredoxin-fold domain-containing protein n=2 Tax=Saccharomonospora viridis TaxID=1852 RepID=C7MU95_SACVD|nr:hypothetical protein [Saccharomonospora viridis]ACU96874.1 hypothetical protein Svir_18510 [Saccharomonospora viridis DSM 43017]KHF43063.1 beta-lactamase [Saccharomonospora viridis]SFO85398.1 hypothetical protein SAMN02982918_0508 [Saccharomonospora viridis]